VKIKTIEINKNKNAFSSPRKIKFLLRKSFNLLISESMFIKDKIFASKKTLEASHAALIIIKKNDNNKAVLDFLEIYFHNLLTLRIEVNKFSFRSFNNDINNSTLCK